MPTAWLLRVSGKRVNGWQAILREQGRRARIWIIGLIAGSSHYRVRVPDAGFSFRMGKMKFQPPVHPKLLITSQVQGRGLKYKILLSPRKPIQKTNFFYWHVMLIPVPTPTLSIDHHRIAINQHEHAIRPVEPNYNHQHSCQHNTASPVTIKSQVERADLRARIISRSSSINVPIAGQ
jgi:hypothetical protein